MPTFLRAHPTIGVLSGQPVYSARLSQYIGLVSRGISAAAQQRQCNLLFSCGIGSSGTGYAFRNAWPLADATSNFVPVGPWNTDALLVVQPVIGGGQQAYLDELSQAGFPVIFIGPRSTGRAVMADNTAGIHAALRHLVAHGHRQIAFLAGFANHPGDSTERLEAYISGLRQLRLPVDPALIAYGEHNWFGGQRAMRELCESGRPFSAIITSNDESARGALDWLKKIGQRVPDDVAVIGFDDQTEARGTSPALTSIHNPMFEIGWQALELALRAAGGEAPREASVRIPTRLVVRQSCGCAPIPETNLSDGSQTMQAMVANETRYLEPERVSALCAQLLEAWQTSAAQSNPQPFQQALGGILTEMEAANDDAHAWQAALSFLAQQPLTPAQNQWLHAARVIVSESARRQHHYYILMQWVDDDVARLTARLLAAKDEGQVIQILDDEMPLAPSMPALSIQRAQIALLEAEDGLPTANSRILSGRDEPGMQFRTREFPVPALGYSEPFSLALLPLAFQDAGSLPGYVIMEMANLSPYAAFIVQHLTVALNSARLYREATEGRRLAEEASRIKSRFLSMVSHELRTPLSVIVGLSEMALRSGAADNRSDLERIYASARHLSGLIGDVLDLASSEAGQIKFVPDLLDFQEVLKPVLTVAEHLTQSKGLAWQLTLPGVPLPVRGDATRLRQVTLNMLNNAVKFTAHGYVALTVVIEAQTLIITVSDSGVGIPLNERAEIFDEFRQSERTAARGYGGVGLGLAISKRIVEMHGGQIGVESSGEEGAGSTFFFRLPLLTEPLPMAESAPNAAASVLVLHEIADPNNLLVLQYLENEGYAVQECVLAGNPDWLNQAAAAHPNALVLNMQTNSSQTWQIFHRIKDHSLTRNLPILLYTLVQEQNRGDLIEMDYLSKPVSSQNLWQSLQRQGLTSKNKEDARTILVVDDEPDIRVLHCRMVQEHAPDYRVLSAADGVAALEILQSTPVDLVLLDLMMPQMDGFTLLKHLRENGLNRDVPVIVLTAQILNESEMARLNHGVARVLGKGMFTIPETLAHVGAALARNQKMGGETQRLVRKAMAYIHTHYADAVTRKEIARYANVNEDYLTHCFQQELGLSPVAYITRYRIQQARQLLTRGSMNITAVAQAVGIFDSDYFSRVFRQETGLSPREYRRSQQNLV